MGFSIRGIGVPDGSIDTAKLANNAVTNDKLADGSVDPTKATTELASDSFAGTEVPQTITGTGPTSVYDLKFHTGTAAAIDYKKFTYRALLKSSLVTNTVTIQVYIDSTPYGVGETTTSLTSVVVGEADIDISGLSSGNHTLEVYLSNSDGAESATIEQFDLYLSKK